MTKAHPHRQVNVHLDTVDDADIIERIEAQPSMVGYVRKLVRRDIHDERLDYAALKESGLQAENAKLRELALALYAELLTYSKTPHYNVSVWEPRLAECGIDASGIEAE